jgi:hypothetical protein
MARIFVVGGWLAAAFAIVITLLLGPVVAAYAFVAGALAIIAVLMVAQLARGVDDWRLDHASRYPRRKRHTE